MFRQFQNQEAALQFDKSSGTELVFARTIKHVPNRVKIWSCEGVGEAEAPRGSEAV